MVPGLVPLARKAVKAGQAILQAGMLQRCPIYRGDLRRSIHSTRVKAGRHSVGGGVVASSRHAVPLEFGTIHMRGHPFVRPTRDIDGPKAERVMARILRDGTRG